MSKKFGAPQEFWKGILNKCKELEMKVKGISFHVGSGGCSINSYQEALKNARDIFMMGKDIGHDEMDLLDIGGGFSMSAEKPENNFDLVGPKLQQ
jgi:ornithine decarboxylase